MKLCKETVEIIKNFSTINSSIVIKPGNRIRTITPQSTTILGEAKVLETFPNEFGIYNLSEFLGVLSLFDTPELTFHDRYLTVEEDDFVVKYEYCSPSLISTPPDKEIVMDATQKIFLSKDQLARTMKAAAVLGTPDMTFTGDGKDAIIAVKDAKNASSNQFSLRIPGVWVDDATVYHIRLENLKLFPGAYNIELSKTRKAVHFDNVGMNHLHYYVALVPAIKE